MSKRIVFMGTPIFAAKILEFLIKNDVNIVGVVSQPDKKVGRKRELSATPVKEIALKYGINVSQPNKIKEEFDFLDIFKPDIIITAAYGQIVPQEVLNYPKLGCFNVHGSLLPKYRGGAPIHYSILNGDKETGVTIMEMVQKMDAGDIVTQKSFPINFEDTLENVHDNMIVVAQKLLLDTLPLLLEGNYEKVKQDETKVTYSPNIKPEEELINWNKNGLEIYNHIRGLNPWPVAYSVINNKRFKFFETNYVETDNSSINSRSNGEVLDVNLEGIIIKVDGGTLQVKEFQIEGKKKNKIENILNGNTFIKKGMKFENKE